MTPDLDPTLQALALRDVEVAQLRRENAALKLALVEALDNWESGQEDQTHTGDDRAWEVRIAELRKLVQL